MTEINQESKAAEHTPAPWRFHDMEPNTIVAGRPGGEVCNTLNGFGDQQANAEFIIRACNAHDDLLAVLRMVVDTLDNEEMGEGAPAKDWVASWHTIHETARAAIAKATGER